MASADSIGLVKIDQAAKLLGYSVGHTRRLFLEGKIPGYKPLGRKGAVLFSVSELKAFIENGRVPTKYEIAEKATEILNQLSRERKAKAHKKAMKAARMAKAAGA